DAPSCPATRPSVDGGSTTRRLSDQPTRRLSDPLALERRLALPLRKFGAALRGARQNPGVRCPFQFVSCVKGGGLIPKPSRLHAGRGIQCLSVGRQAENRELERRVRGLPAGHRASLF